MRKAALFSSLCLFAALQAASVQPEMVGSITREQILLGNPEWSAVVASYAPAPEAIDKLKRLDRPVHIEVFLGTWCPDSQRHVSEFFKVLDLADTPMLIAAYIGIPKQKEARPEYYGGKDIQRIPTFIITADGQEKGRIIEIPVKSVEQDLVDILFR